MTDTTSAASQYFDLSPQTSLERHALRWPAIDTWAFRLMCVYVAECVIGGSGRWLSFGPLSIRHVLMLTILALTLPRLVQALPRIIRHPQTIILMLLVLVVGIGAAVGVNNGHDPAFIVNDVTTLASLVLVPSFLVTVDSTRRLRTLVKTVVIAGAALSTGLIALHFATRYSDELISAVNMFLNRRNMGGLAVLSGDLHRIYVRSAALLLLALPLALHIYGQTRSRWSALVMPLIGFAIVLTYTRSILVGAITATVLVILLKRLTGASPAGLLPLGIGVAVLFGLSALVYAGPVAAKAVALRFDTVTEVGSVTTRAPSTDRQLDSGSIDAGDPDSNNAEAEAVSSAVRSNSVAAQLSFFEDRPIFGWGLGKNVDLVREDGRTEYMYLDYLTKLGTIGTVALLMAFFWLPAKGMWALLRRAWHGIRINFDEKMFAASAVGLLAIAATSALNPYLNSSLGISALLVTLSGYEIVQRHQHEERQSA